MSTGLTVLQQEDAKIREEFPEPTQEEVKAYYESLMLSQYGANGVTRFAYISPGSEKITTDTQGREIRSAYVFSCHHHNIDGEITANRWGWRAITIVEDTPVMGMSVTTREMALRDLDKAIVQIMMNKMGV